MNVYDMYLEHGKRPGFWLRRITWGNTVAKVTSVGALKGRPPYYGNPEVTADIFDLHSGALKENGAAIPVPGTFKTWRWVQPPEWSGEPPFDPEEGRVILHVPFAMNSQAKKIGATWSALLDAFWLPADNGAAVEKARELGFLTPPPPRVFFRLPYERRGEASALNAQFHGDHKLWSLSSDDHQAVAAATASGFDFVDAPPAPRKPLLPPANW